MDFSDWKRRVGLLKRETYALYLAARDPRVPWYAKWLIAPGNAVPMVQNIVRTQAGRVSEGWYGHGVLEGLRVVLNGAGLGATTAAE